MIVLKRRFVECASCAAKPGSPALCQSCLYNRETIRQLQSMAISARRMLEFSAKKQLAWLKRHAG